MRNPCAVLACTLTLLFACLANAQPLSTAFTFQGRLTNGAAPASGSYDLRFRLYDAPAAGAQLGPVLCSNNLPVTGGVVATQLDFGSQFAGQRRWLEVDVRQDTGLDCTSAAGFTTLSPRQEVTAAPNALFASAASTATTATTATTAANAANATSLNNQPPSFYQNAANLSSGTIPAARLSGPYTNALTLSNASNSITGSFTGSGAGLSNVPFSSLTGVPATVSLQGTTPGSAQTGNLNLTGEGLFSGIGIGTTSPAVQLHIADPSVARLRVDSTAGAQIILQAQSSLARIGTANSFPLNFVVGGNDKMYLTTSGRLGIGTSVPDADLHISRAPAGTITANSNALLALENSSSTYINLLAPDANETGILFGRPGSPQTSAAGGIIYNNVNNPDGLQFRAGGNSTRMAIDSSGNVGIGTLNPTARFQVVGPAADSTVALPDNSIAAAELLDEPGLACDIVNSGDTLVFFSGLHTAASRTITCPTAGYILAIGTVTIWADVLNDGEIFVGASSSSSAFLSSNKHRHTTLAGKESTVTVHGVFSVPAGSKTIYLLVQPQDSGRSLGSAAAHLTLVFIPTAYGTVDLDQ